LSFALSSVRGRSVRGGSGDFRGRVGWNLDTRRVGSRLVVQDLRVTFMSKTAKVMATKVRTTKVRAVSAMSAVSAVRAVSAVTAVSAVSGAKVRATKVRTTMSTKVRTTMSTKVRTTMSTKVRTTK